MYQYLLKHPECFPAVLGITNTQFDALVLKVHPILFRLWKTRVLDPRRARGPGGGRKRLFATDADLVFLIVFYYKVYPTFRFAQVIFELDKKNIWHWVEVMKGVLWEAVGHQLMLPTKKIRHLGQLLTICPQLQEFLVDATERQIERPQDQKIQEQYYSGKKKMHTIKNQLLVHPRTGKIMAVSQTVEGKRHDKKLAEDDPTLLRAPPGATGMGDNGYQGGEGINPLISFVYPTRKPQKHDLTQTQKDTNRTIAQIRVKVEHPLAYLKHFHVLAHRWRNTIERADLPFRTIAALYNFTR